MEQQKRKRQRIVRASVLTNTATGFAVVSKAFATDDFKTPTQVKKEVSKKTDFELGIEHAISQFRKNNIKKVERVNPFAI